MRMKLIAMGNVLMKDDGVAIGVSNEIEENLANVGIEVIYGETDFEYCLSRMGETDYIFIVDAADNDKLPGEITRISLNSFVPSKHWYSQHSYSFLDLLKLYYPTMQGEIFAIQIKEVALELGLSAELTQKLNKISREILEWITIKIEELDMI